MRDAKRLRRLRSGVGNKIEDHRPRYADDIASRLPGTLENLLVKVPERGKNRINKRHEPEQLCDWHGSTAASDCPLRKINYRAQRKQPGRLQREEGL